MAGINVMENCSPLLKTNWSKIGNAKNKERKSAEGEKGEKERKRKKEKYKER